MLERSKLYNIIILIGTIICLILAQFDALKIALVILQMILIVIALFGFHHHFISINTIEKYNDGALQESHFLELLTIGSESERIFFAKLLAQYYEHRTSVLYSITRDYALSVNFSQDDSVLKVLQENNSTESNRKLALDISKSDEYRPVIDSHQKIVDKFEDMVILFGKKFTFDIFSSAILEKVLLPDGLFSQEITTRKNIEIFAKSIAECEFKFKDTSELLLIKLNGFTPKVQDL